MPGRGAEDESIPRLARLGPFHECGVPNVEGAFVYVLGRKEFVFVAARREQYVVQHRTESPQGFVASRQHQPLDLAPHGDLGIGLGLVDGGQGRDGGLERRALGRGLDLGELGGLGPAGAVD